MGEDMPRMPAPAARGTLLGQTSTLALHPGLRKGDGAEEGDTWDPKEFLASSSAPPGCGPFSMDVELSRDECELQDMTQWIRSVLCAEVASINQKLDKLVADCELRNTAAEKITFSRLPPSRSPRPPAVRSPKVHSGPPTPSSLASQVPRSPQDAALRGPPLSINMEKLKKARAKIRFISTMAAAAERAKRRDTAVDPTTSVSPSKHDFSTRTSNRSIPKQAKFMPSMWDDEAGARMKDIQKLLHADKSKKSWRMKLWQLMESPYSSKLAFTFAWVSNILVISSVVAGSLEGLVFDWVQCGFESLFAVEFLMRLLCCPHRCAFLGSPFTWLDIMSIAPLAFRWSSSHPNETVLALVPMLRLFKPLRRFEKLRLMVDAFSLALEALPFLLYSLALIAIVFAEIIFFAEPSANIPDLPSALWFTIVTMTTVGYGDISPTTTEGHLAASALMVISALYMAMPLGIVGDAFSRVWADRDRLLVIKRFRGAFLEGGYSLQSFEDVFNVFDSDDSGTLDVDEFASMLKTIQLKMTEERINVLFATLDTDGTGQITLQALINLLAPKAFAAQIFEQGRCAAQIFEQEADRAMKSLNPLSFIVKSKNTDDDSAV